MSETMEFALSEDAVRLATHLVQISEKGLNDPIGWSTVLERFSASEKSDMAEAAFELDQLFLVSIGKAMGAPDGISHIRPDYALYWLLDREVFGYDTNADTITLINLILEDEKLGRAPALRNAVDWPLRRFNPPFAQIVQEIPDGRVSRPMQPDYPAMAVLITAEDKVLLRKLRSALEEAQSAPETETGEELAIAPQASSVLDPEKKGWFSWFLSHPNWTGIGVLVAIVSVVLVFYPPKEWGFANDKDPEQIGVQSARTALQELAPSKDRIAAVLRHFDFGSSPRTSNEQAKSMMLFLHPTELLSESRGAGATTGTFGVPDSNGLQYEVTIWKNSYERPNVYGIRFGLSDSAYWGCNDSYFEVVKLQDSTPHFVLNTKYAAPCD